MYICKARIWSPAGLHAQAAVRFAETAQQYGCTVLVEPVEQNGCADGKSVVSLLSLALKKDAEVRIITDGPQELAAGKALATLLGSGLTEDERSELRI